MATLLFGSRALIRSPHRAVVTIGMFDGVHRAHQRLIRTTRLRARRLRATSVVITFDPDPQGVLSGSPAVAPLMPLGVRLDLIRRLGIDWIWVIRFTRAFSQVTPERFVRELLGQRLHAACIVVGENFMFGSDRRGTREVLQRLGRSCGIRVETLAPIRDHGELISSSRIRRCVHEGRVEEAARLLGRPPMLWGRIIHGAGRGHQLGFPTANIRLKPTLFPREGVYRVELAIGRRRMRGVMNLGRRPTFGPGPLTCEVHCPGLRGSLYGRAATLSLQARLRDERRFETPDQLVDQIRRDLRHAHLLMAV